MIFKDLSSQEFHPPISYDKSFNAVIPYILFYKSSENYILVYVGISYWKIRYLSLFEYLLYSKDLSLARIVSSDPVSSSVFCLINHLKLSFLVRHKLHEDSKRIITNCQFMIFKRPHLSKNLILQFLLINPLMPYQVPYSA